MSCTILVVDDQADFRRQVCLMLQASGHTVVGEASDARSALEMARALRPEAVLLDVRLPDGSGVDVGREIATWAEPPIIILTSTADYSDAIGSCGAQAFIPKGSLDGPTIEAALGSS